jgi:hypothetical protein
MSDFLRNVLRRGAGLAPVLAPRPPDLLGEAAEIMRESEPVDASRAVLTPQTPVEARTLPAPSASLASVPHAITPATGKQLEPAATPSAATPASSETGPPVRPASVPERAIEMTLPPASPAAPREQAVLAPALAAAVVLTPVSEPVPEIPPNRPLPVIEPLPPPSRAESHPPQQEASRQPVVRREAEPPAVYLPPEIRQEPAPEVMPGPSRPVTPAVAEAFPDGGADRLEPGPQEPEATSSPVHVTIGRIEVRHAVPIPRRQPRGFDDLAAARRYLDRRWY